LRRYIPILSGVGPALAAFLIVLLEPAITAWMKGRESVLPLAVLLLLTALLHPRLRQLLMVTLCFGVTFLAFRDSLHAQPLPPLLAYEPIEEIGPAALILVAGLAALAAIAETVQPGTVWARRCYFGAAALYFSGIGFINFAWHSSWQSVMLCATGIIALFGCLFAHRIIAEEAESFEETAPSDEDIQREREAAHLRALRAKEWRDSFAVVEGEAAPADGSSQQIGAASAPKTAPQ